MTATRLRIEQRLYRGDIDTPEDDTPLPAPSPFHQNGHQLEGMDGTGGQVIPKAWVFASENPQPHVEG